MIAIKFFNQDLIENVQPGFVGFSLKVLLIIGRIIIAIPYAQNTSRGFAEIAID